MQGDINRRSINRLCKTKMSKAIDALREFAERYIGYYNAKSKWITSPVAIDKLTALISEHYYPKEFVEWKDKKELRYSSLHKRYYSDTDNGMREFTLDELFNYWKENEQ